MFIILVEFKTAASYFETCSFSDLLQWLWMVKNNLARLVFRSADFLKLYLFVSMSKPEAVAFGVTPLDALRVNSRPDRRRAGVGAVTCEMADVIRLLAWGNADFDTMTSVFCLLCCLPLILPYFWRAWLMSVVMFSGALLFIRELMFNTFNCCVTFKI